MDKHLALLMETKIDLAKKIRDNLYEEIKNIPNLTDRELLENIYKELIVFVRYRQLTDLED